MNWQGHLLPSLTEELAISYHNECIRELLQLSLNQRKLHDETLLAAVVILRTDEEMLHEAEDKQFFHPTLAEDAIPSPPFQTDSEMDSNGLRQACFWTALRQDLHAAFLQQQPVKFSLSRCEAFRHFGPAPDATWANRMVVFCADVLEFCYGSDSIDAKVHPGYTNRDRWCQLHSYEKSLCASLPLSFEPTITVSLIRHKERSFQASSISRLYTSVELLTKSWPECYSAGSIRPFRSSVTVARELRKWFWHLTRRFCSDCAASH